MGFLMMKEEGKEEDELRDEERRRIKILWYPDYVIDWKADDGGDGNDNV